MKNTALLLLVLISIFSCQEDKARVVDYPDQSIEITSTEAAKFAEQVKDEVNTEIHDDFELSLWAGDKLVQDPIAISISPEGKIYYTQASRQSNSEFDIRGHRNWMTASISFQTVEDRRKFLQETFTVDNEESEKFLKDLNEDGTLDWRDLTVSKEQVWIVEDQTGSGYADKSSLYLEDFNEEITDVANGIEYSDGKIYIAVGPDVWATEDTDDNGIADEVESLSHGYAVHIGFSGHGMSGVTRGPDGRLWWGIGDIGSNVVDKTGKRWKNPNRGIIARSEIDGTGFEIFCHGVRNTHEFAFDKYGNLITEDNDGDHGGERERLVYLMNGSETGWRINWQFGKYTDPLNNKYKVWMDEKMHVPHWEGQAAYFLPPITNFVNGPTGFVYNPGTALSPEWYDHFFVAEFRGTPANSPIHGFKVKPDGAGFALDTSTIIAKGLLPTGLDFGPDGALYFGDWIDGWNTNNAGRIWKLDIPGEATSAIRQETKKLIQADFSQLENDQLAIHLGHQDMRVRQKAQFELALRGDTGHTTLLAVANESTNQLARIHSLWGIGQLARLENKKYAKSFVSFLSDSDVEIVTHAAKQIGDVKYKGGIKALLPLLENDNPRLVSLTMEALGRLEAKAAVAAILKIVEANNDEDLWIRHMAMIALGRIGDEAALTALVDHPSRAMRTMGVIALRRMESPAVTKFLNDKNEYIIAEAARAINDDYSIEKALPVLAEILDNNKLTNEAVIRRSINANLRVGRQEDLERLMRYTINESAPEAMRIEAISTVSTWSKPSVFDRVDGRYRGEITRDPAPAIAAAESTIDALLTDKNQTVKIEATKLIGRIGIMSKADDLFAMLSTSKKSKLRKAALSALNELNAPNLDEALEIALRDKMSSVRATALAILPESKIEGAKAASLLTNVLSIGSTKEKKAALSSLGVIKDPQAISALTATINDMLAGNIAPELHLDLIEAAETQDDPALNKLLVSYHNTKDAEDPLRMYREALAGGEGYKGRDLFYNHQGAQCVRCHAIFEYGGNAGPGLMGVGARLSKEEILASMVTPSVSYAPGYEVVSVELNSGDTKTGIAISEDAESIKLKIGKEEIVEIPTSDIKSRESIPSSMFPMGDILTKREMRDLVAFLSSLTKEV